MCSLESKEKVDKKSAFWETLLATSLGGLLAILGSLILFHLQSKDKGKDKIISSVLKTYGEQKSCFSGIRPTLSKMFDQGEFTGGNKDFLDVHNYLETCKEVGRKFYFQLIQFEILQKSDHSSVKNCVITSFDNYKDITLNDLRAEKIDLLKLDAEYIQPQIQCSIVMFRMIDEKIEETLLD